MFYSEQLRQQDPTLHQSTISGATKAKWGSMTREEQEVWLAPARVEMEAFKAKNPNFFKERALRTKRKQASNLDDQNSSKKQKTLAPSPFPEAEPPMAYQAPNSILAPAPQSQNFLPQGLQQMAPQAPGPMQHVQQPFDHQIHQQLSYTVPSPMSHIQEAPRLSLENPEQPENIDPLLEQMRFVYSVPEAQENHQKKESASDTQVIESQNNNTDEVQDGQANEVHEANEVQVTNAIPLDDQEDEEIRFSLLDMNNLFGNDGAGYDN